MIERDSEGKTIREQTIETPLPGRQSAAGVVRTFCKVHGICPDCRVHWSTEINGTCAKCAAIQVAKRDAERKARGAFA